MYIFLSHDVDWPKHGPGKKHILERKSRFPKDIILKVINENYNPYYNIPQLMDFEKNLGIRSTFFFRVIYDDGSEVFQYEDILKELKKGGWEIGLHLLDPSSLDRIVEEKRILEELINKKIKGNRTHYLRSTIADLPKFKKAGFLYDSSIMFSKGTIDVRNMGYFIKEIVEVPITIMDTYLFSYMKTKEKDIKKIIREAIQTAIGAQKSLITILWHDASLQMFGGRMYYEVIYELLDLEDIKFIKGEEILEVIQSKDGGPGGT